MAGSTFQAKMNRQGQEYIEAGVNTVRQLWAKCCEHDGIEPSAKFVVWSDDNPYVKFYNQAYRQLQEARQQYADGGYVGLSLTSR